MPTHAQWEPWQIQSTTMPHLCGLVHRASRSRLGNSGWIMADRVKGFGLLGPWNTQWLSMMDMCLMMPCIWFDSHTTNYIIIVCGCLSLLFLHPSALVDVFCFVIGMHLCHCLSHLPEHYSEGLLSVHMKLTRSHWIAMHGLCNKATWYSASSNMSYYFEA